MDGQTNRYGFSMFLYYMDASENDDFSTDLTSFTKALRSNGQTDGPTDLPKDGHTFL